MDIPFIVGNKRVSKYKKNFLKKIKKSTCIYFEFEII